MEKILTKIINFIDENYHQKKINQILKKIKIDNVVDIGAHKGEFLYNIMKIKNRINIYSFEPQIEICNQLKKKFKKIKNVKISNFAISDKNIVKRLNISIKSSTSTFSNYNQKSYWKKIKDFLLSGLKNQSIIRSEKVKTITLDHFFKKKRFKIDLLKIDTEGHEYQVLKGAKKLLKKNVRFILIEFHLSKIYSNYNKKKIEKILSENNFFLLKKFKFPFLQFEDRVYKKINQ
tara:strand:+ start:497 stop:1195 length:699 start_codon:yes stop_codon:yes gene_type:complete